MSYFTMTASLLPRNIFRLSGTLLYPNVNRRLCSTSGGNDGGYKKDDNTKLLDFLSKQKKIHKKPAKPVELKAKPIKRNISKKDSSSSSSSDSDEELSESLVVATKNVAKSKSRKIKDGDTREKVKNEVETALTRKLKSIGSETKDARQKSEVKGDAVNVDILSSLKVFKKPEESQDIKTPVLKPLSDEQAAFLKERNRKRTEARNKQMAKEYEPVNLFEDEKPLGIFQASQSEDTACETLKTWQAISNREMGILTTQSPRNLIEDMASMTEKGILWHFPINNEQGIDEDQMDSFIEHVFLERHVESWCPQSGPLRDFMEAVCTTLSKNAFMTVEKKLEYIDWFRDYFDQPHQKEILEISGALDG